MAVRRFVTLIAVVTLPLLGTTVACVPEDGTPPTGSTTTTIPTSCTTELKSIKTAAEAYRTVEGGYPATIAGIEEYLGGPVDPARWTYSGGGAAYALTGVGVCTGLSYTTPTPA